MTEMSWMEVITKEVKRRGYLIIHKDDVEKREKELKVCRERMGYHITIKNDAIAEVDRCHAKIGRYQKVVDSAKRFHQKWHTATTDEEAAFLYAELCESLQNLDQGEKR